jgi:hypothetical protein
MCDKIFYYLCYKFNAMNRRRNKNYTVKNGRLINNAEEPSTGLWKSAQRRKAIKRFEKMSMIAEANQMSKGMNEL